jgi:hypothetical protein
MELALSSGAFSFSGFVTAVLYQENPLNALPDEERHVLKSAQKERYFLISIGFNSKPNKPSKGKLKSGTNRKAVTHKNEIEVLGYKLPVNSKKSGCYTQILHQMAEQLIICYEKWKRVFVYRFDFHQAFYTENSKQVSDFLRRLRSWIMREYTCQMGFVWVRELEKATVQHYHLVIFLDGDKIQHSAKLAARIRQMWADNTCGNRHMPTIEHPFHKVKDSESLNKAFYRISYLAKARGKGLRPPQSKDFGCSRFKLDRQD